jgi:hypothetical protein
MLFLDRSYLCDEEIIRGEEEFVALSNNHFFSFKEVIAVKKVGFFIPAIDFLMSFSIIHFLG